MTLCARQFRREHKLVADYPVRLTTYELAGRWYCHVDNVAPGAIVARGGGMTREQAMIQATQVAEVRLRRTRRRTV